tara:strand:+ start:2857 stop:3726 length:870 start_codon:yes stop_codon:yes gene_type:complete
MYKFYCHFGEVGYELLGWSGFVREQALNNKDIKTVILGRPSFNLVYPYAHELIDITQIPEWKDTSACCQGFRGRPPSITQEFKENIFKLIKDHYPNLSEKQIKDNLFFSDTHPLPDIYRNKIGSYEKLEIDLAAREEVEAKVGFSLEEPYVLIQNAWREQVIRCGFEFSEDNYRNILKDYTNYRKVFIDFSDSRKHQSQKSPTNYLREVCTCIECNNLAEQSILFSFSKYNLFFTEGDFRSHCYFPPMFGKDVKVFCSKKVQSLDGCAVDFWNEFVFTFGGHIELHGGF